MGSLTVLKNLSQISRGAEPSCTKETESVSEAIKEFRDDVHPKFKVIRT